MSYNNHDLNSGYKHLSQREIARIQYKLKESVPIVKRQIEELEEAKKVTQRTMRLEFVI